MSRPVSFPHIETQLKVWLEQRMAEWSIQPELLRADLRLLS
jgi:hypothetical protein